MGIYFHQSNIQVELTALGMRVVKMLRSQSKSGLHIPRLGAKERQFLLLVGKTDGMSQTTLYKMQQDESLLNHLISRRLICVRENSTKPRYQKSANIVDKLSLEALHASKDNCGYDFLAAKQIMLNCLDYASCKPDDDVYMQICDAASIQVLTALFNRWKHRLVSASSTASHNQAIVWIEQVRSRLYMRAL